MKDEGGLLMRTWVRRRRGGVGGDGADETSAPWTVLYLVGAVAGAVLALAVAELIAVYQYNTSLLDKAFFQQLLTTFIAVASAVALALWLYDLEGRRSDRQERDRLRGAAERDAAERDEAFDLLLRVIHKEIAHNWGLLQAGPLTLGWLAKHWSKRLRCTTLEWACRRVVELREDYELAGEMAFFLDDCQQLNRCLDSFAGLRILSQSGLVVDGTVEEAADAARRVCKRAPELSRLIQKRRHTQDPDSDAETASVT